MNNKEISNLITQLARVRNVDINYVVQTLKMSIIAGLKRRFGDALEAEVEIVPEAGDIKVFIIKKVVSSVTDSINQIELSKAREINPAVKVGDTLRIVMPLEEIGRIAIRKASDELILKLREAERNKLYDEFVKKKGEIVTGTVQKIGRDEIIVNLGLIEASLPNREQLKTDHYRQGMPIKAYVHRVEKTPIGPRIFLSRTHPEFLRKLLFKEVPEIRQGVVEIKGIARVPGSRSKVAVSSNDDKVDPVGACVGFRKSRIENIIKELSGEKVDIVQWNKDLSVFIPRALGPAKVSEVIKEGDTYIVIVPDSDFSVAIGKKGQNVWLASLLVGAKVEVLKQSDYKNRALMNLAKSKSIADLELPEDITTKLQDAQIFNAFDLLNAPTEELAKSTNLEVSVVEELKKDVRNRIWPE
uniref:Transcription termination/antitermination protein NusA n=1 Tax=candidate division WOR-3 bacterium TaxID=2052148 RepID=A0A7C6EC07_UNCW3